MFKNMIGIYKITSPTGRVYIGQSRDINKRFSSYYRLQCTKQPKLYFSLKKYGVDNHEFSIIHICKPEELNKLERYYQELFNVLENGLNCILTESDKKCKVISTETRRKISSAMRGKLITLESRRKMSESTKESHAKRGLKPKQEIKLNDSAVTQEKIEATSKIKDLVDSNGFKYVSMILGITQQCVKSKMVRHNWKLGELAIIKNIATI